MIDVDLLQARSVCKLNELGDETLKRTRYYKISINILRGGEKRQATWVADEAVQALQILRALQASGSFLVCSRHGYSNLTMFVAPQGSVEWIRVIKSRIQVYNIAAIAREYLSGFRNCPMHVSTSHTDTILI